MAEIIDCQKYLDEAKENARNTIFGLRKFYILTSGKDKASKTYINAKIKDFADCGIVVNVVHIPSDYCTEAVCRCVSDIQAHNDCGGLIVQLPLPSHICEEDVLREIHKKKDVDGLCIANTSLNFKGETSACTASGIVKMLRNEADLEGATVTVIGRSNIVGKPLIPLLLAENATVISANSHTREDKLIELCQSSDIIISAVGKPNFITRKHLSKDKKQILVDVGINRLEDGTIIGDIDRESVEAWCYKMTTVPGGVGLLTRAELINNFVKLAGATPKVMFGA